ALLCAFKKLKKNGFYVHTQHCTIKHFNNLIEQDHRHIKRRFAKSAGFRTLRHASRTIKGIETIHALYKQRRSLQKDSAFSTYKELHQLLATS
ncbi:DDE-type integrase/transposase/recombinase, partial [Bacillus toyonensis]